MKALICCLGVMVVGCAALIGEHEFEFVKDDTVYMCAPIEWRKDDSPKEAICFMPGDLSPRFQVYHDRADHEWHVRKDVIARL